MIDLHHAIKHELVLKEISASQKKAYYILKNQSGRALHPSCYVQLIIIIVTECEEWKEQKK